MKLHQLRHLVAVAAEGSIRAAARALGVSQATVTQSLRELELEAQIPLLKRHSAGVRLTPAGQDVLAHSQRALAQIRQAEESLARHRDQLAPQRLSVGLTPWVAQTLMTRVVPRFRVAMPHIQLELFDGLSTQSYPRLREGQLDLMIGRITHPDLMEGLQATPLFSYEMTVIARRGHPAAQAKSMAELQDYDWVLNFTPAEQAPALHNLFGQHGLTPPMARIQLAHSAMLMLALVRQTDMLSFCPWPLVETSDLRSHVVALPVVERFNVHQVGIVHRVNESLSPAAVCFLDIFQQQVEACMASDDPELKRVFYSVETVPPPPSEQG